jgi:16S rRNA (guanine527-N7)-methyltransferase
LDDATRELFAQAGATLDDADRDFFERVRLALVDANARMNLTRLVEPADYYRKHVLDSALPFHAVRALRDLGARGMAADLGSGAGFPGLVFARLRPEWDVALIERTQKKAGFLEDLVETLGLERVYVVPLDAHEVPRRVGVLRRGCDVVLARAVGRLGPVTEAAAPLLRPGGVLVHYKGGDVDQAELEEGRAAAKRFGLEQEAPVAYDLPPDARRSVVCCVSRARRRTRT